MLCRHTTVAVTRSTVDGDSLRSEALDDFARLRPSSLGRVSLNPASEVEIYSLQCSLNE